MRKIEKKIWIFSQIGGICLIYVVWRRFRQRFRCGEQRVGKFGRMRQRSVHLGSASVGHQPAGDSNCHSHQSEQCRNDQGDDEAHGRYAHFLPHYVRSCKKKFKFKNSIIFTGIYVKNMEIILKVNVDWIRLKWQIYLLWVHWNAPLLRDPRPRWNLIGP